MTCKRMASGFTDAAYTGLGSLRGFFHSLLSLRSSPDRSQSTFYIPGDPDRDPDPTVCTNSADQVDSGRCIFYVNVEAGPDDSQLSDDCVFNPDCDIQSNDNTATETGLTCQCQGDNVPMATDSDGNPQTGSPWKRSQQSTAGIEERYPWWLVLS